MTTTFQIPHGDQLVSFDGELLGAASSEEFAKSEGRRNWHVVQIFKTTLGDYVIHKAGMTEVPGQVNRHTVHQATTPGGAVECLQGVDDDGVVYMTFVARSACRAAARKDIPFREAYVNRNLTPRA